MLEKKKQKKKPFYFWLKHKSYDEIISKPHFCQEYPCEDQVPNNHSKQMNDPNNLLGHHRNHRKYQNLVALVYILCMQNQDATKWCEKRKRKNNLTNIS